MEQHMCSKCGTKFESVRDLVVHVYDCDGMCPGCKKLQAQLDIAKRVLVKARKEIEFFKHCANDDSECEVLASIESIVS